MVDVDEKLYWPHLYLPNTRRQTEFVVKSLVGGMVVDVWAPRHGTLPFPNDAFFLQSWWTTRPFDSKRPTEVPAEIVRQYTREGWHLRVTFNAWTWNEFVYTKLHELEKRYRESPHRIAGSERHNQVTGEICRSIIREEVLGRLHEELIAGGEANGSGTDPKSSTTPPKIGSAKRPVFRCPDCGQQIGKEAEGCERCGWEKKGSEKTMILEP